MWKVCIACVYDESWNDRINSGYWNVNSLRHLTFSSCSVPQLSVCITLQYTKEIKRTHKYSGFFDNVCTHSFESFSRNGLIIYEDEVFFALLFDSIKSFDSVDSFSFFFISMSASLLIEKLNYTYFLYSYCLDGSF